MKRSLILFLVLLFSVYSCSKSKSNNNSTALLALAVLSSAGSTCTSSTSTGSTITINSATLDSGSGCVTGVTTCMDSALPAWIKNNFKCATGYVSGTNYVFKSKNLPNTKSSYYGSSSTLYEARTTTGTNPNSTSSQSLVYTIPSSATKGTGTDSTQGGLVSIGITVNGLAIFNNAAAPPDTLSVEALTFDNFQGHPQNSGVYHHHAAVPKVCDGASSTSNTGACANSTLIGIILDGYALYGQKCDKGTSSTSDDFTPTDLDSLHGHTAVTTHFPTATYHYHYANDPTATIYTLMGSYFYGTKGSVSN
ncbi:MAG: YHYH protein [Leptospira sp.]|nr:YHYH protein [Leptospira sp.]